MRERPAPSPIARSSDAATIAEAEAQKQTALAVQREAELKAIADKVTTAAAKLGAVLRG